MIVQNPLANDILIVKGRCSLHLRGYKLVIKVFNRENTETYSFPIASLKELIIYGSTAVLSTAVINKLSQQRIPIIVISRNNASIITPFLYTTLPETRRKQFKYLESTYNRAALARKMIESKIMGMLSVARYMRKLVNISYEDYVNKIQHMFKEEIKRTTTVEDIRFVEAKYSEKIWKLYSKIIPRTYSFTGRNPRSKDPINSALNYLYAIIYRHVYYALIVAGLDPYIGIMHTEKYGRKPLVYDFSEMFKPIAIRTALVTARTSTLKLDKKQYLTKKTIEIITRKLYRYLKTGNPPPIYSIYKTAYKLKLTFTEGKEFKPHVYVATK